MIRRAAFVAVALLAACGSTRRDRPDVKSPVTVTAPAVATETSASTTPSTVAPTESSVTLTTAAGDAVTSTSAAGAVNAPTPALDGLTIKLAEVGTFTEPTTIAFRPTDDRVYVGERPGTIRAIAADGGAKATVLDIHELVKSGGEQGLLGLTFTRDGRTAYVHYSDSKGDTAIDEFPVGADGVFDATKRRHVLGQQQPHANHNGGQIEIGPDGMLYIGLGDGGSANDPDRHAGKLDGLLGKILRIDPRPVGSVPYGVPADNPFVKRPGARPEIWHYGLRNPWRFSFDATGALWIGDVGQNEIEEIDHVPVGMKGVNFGWSAFEGSKRFNTDVAVDPKAVGPVHEYTHGEGEGTGFSVTGGYRYRGTAIDGLQGAYVFADYARAGVRALDPTNPAKSTQLTTTGEHLVAFGERPDGELFAVSLDGGTDPPRGILYRLTPSG